MISILEDREVCDLRKDWKAFRAVVGREAIWEAVAEFRIRMGLFVDGDIVVIGWKSVVVVLLFVSPFVGSVEVLSCVIFTVLLLLSVEEFSWSSFKIGYRNKLIRCLICCLEGIVSFSLSTQDDISMCSAGQLLRCAQGKVVSLNYFSAGLLKIIT